MEQKKKTHTVAVPSKGIVYWEALQDVAKRKGKTIGEFLLECAEKEHGTEIKTAVESLLREAM